MQALLNLINTIEDARCAIAICAKKNMTIKHRSHNRVLDEKILKEEGFKTDFGGYGSFSRIGLGASFRNRWYISGGEDPRGKPFTALSIHFAGEKWNRPVDEQIKILLQGGGSVADHPDTADIIVMAGTGLTTLVMHDAVLAISEEIFQQTLPRGRTDKFANNRSIKLAGDMAALWRLLSARDELSIRQGIILASSLSDELNILLEGINVNLETGELVRSKRFTGSGPAQVYLDVAMYSLVSIAPEDSEAAKLRNLVRKISTSVAAIPELHGFDALEELRMSLATEFNASNLNDLGLLPKLRILSIEPVGSASPVLESLTGLDAPALESMVVRAVGLKDIDALFNCSTLRSVNLSANPSLDSIEALATSSSSLIELLLEDCAGLTSLEPLTGATELRCIRLKGSGINSLKALSLSYHIEQLSLEYCKNLISLEGLRCQPIIGPDRGEFSLKGCSSIKTLSGLPKLSPFFDTLNLSGMMQLNDLSGIEAVSTISNLFASYTPIYDLTPLLSLKELVKLELTSCTHLVDASPLGFMPKLNSLSINNCSKLQILPDSWPSNLEELAIHGCDQITTLGKLPRGLRKITHYAEYGYMLDSSILDLNGCHKLSELVPLALPFIVESTSTIDLSGCISLESLAGLETMTSLKHINLPTTIKDVTALSRHIGIVVAVDNNSEAAIPETFGQALAELPKFSLRVENSENLVDCTPFGLMKSVISIDLSACPLVEDLKWITSLPELKEIVINYKSPAAINFNVTKLDTQSKIRKLQKIICEDYKLPLPAHLSQSNTKMQSVPPKSRILGIKELKAGLISPCPDEVSKAILRLVQDGDALLFDELVEGCDITQVYSGSSEAIGKIFKSVKASNRPLARWALTAILAAAPKEATRASRIRQDIRQIALKFPLDDLVDVPSLTAFKGLEEVYFEDFPATTFATLAGLNQVRQLRVQNAPRLTSLTGIESASNLELLNIQGSPALIDLAALTKKASFTRCSQLRLHLSSHADLTPFLAIPSIHSLSISCDGPLPDLSPLIHISHLEFESLSKSITSPSDPSVQSPVFQWSFKLPSLTNLSIISGSHDFSSLEAPNLEAFDLRINYEREGSKALLFDMRGLGNVSKFTLYAQVLSLNGLEGNPARKLDLRFLEGQAEDLSALKEMSELRELVLPDCTTVLPEKFRLGLQCLNHIEKLQCPNFTGSLAFLEGWNNLRVLDLRDSGDLKDLDCLAKLPKLELILLRGSKLKRESWPEILQSKLEYIRAYAE